MPPVFKKPKEYDPDLARKTMQHSLPKSSQRDDDRRQMLVELGLADDGDELAPGSSDEEEDGEQGGSAAAVKADKKAAEAETPLSGAIGAFYPGDSPQSGNSKYMQDLQARTAAAVQHLQGRFGSADPDTADAVQTLLLDLQRQVELQQRGQDSLRTSMGTLRRKTKEAEDQRQLLETEHEEQRQAIRRAVSMNAKLETALHTAANAQLQLAEVSAQLQAREQQLAQLKQDATGKEAAQVELHPKDSALADSQRDVRRLTAEAASLAAELERERSNSTGLQQALATSQGGQQKAQSAAEAELRQQLEAAQQQLQQKQEQLQQAQQQLQQTEQQLSASKAELIASQQQLQAAHTSSHSSSSSNEGNTQKQQAAALAAAKQQLEQKVAELESALSAGRQEIHQLQSANKQEVAQLQASAAADRDAASRDIAAAVQRCAALEAAAAAGNSAAGDAIAAAQQRCATLEAAAAADRDAARHNLAAAEQRCADLEAAAAAHAAAAQHQAAAAEKRSAALEAELSQLRAHAEGLSSGQSLLQGQYAAEAEAHRHAQEQLAVLTAEKNRLVDDVKRAAAQQGAAAEQLQALAAKHSEANAQVAALRAERDGLQERLVLANTEAAKNARKAADELASLRATAAAAQQALAQVQSQYEQRVAVLQREADQQVEQYKQQWRVEFDKRRRLHNQIIELKGNIRVLARIRPLLGKELANEAAATSQSGGALPVEATSEETIAINAPAGSKEFEFDRVFQQQEGQEQVFDEVAPLVTSVLDGYNVCIIAYGQTGSGKTHTMEGPQDNPGVNTRALRELFRAAEERSSEMSFSFAASVLEIYQEQIFDLLSGSRDTGDKLDVKEGPEGMHVPGLRQEGVASLEEVSRVLQKGKQNRTTFATNMNEHSSRSHLVVSLYVKALDLKTGATWHAKLHLIDLAGSERLSRSGAQGDRLKEAQAINKSLSALGDVISALQQRTAHVPYRNSKLTRLLEDSLGGNSKTLMFVNCSPAAENVGETKCSLEFASRARKVELGAAKRNLDSSCSFAQREAGREGGGSSSSGVMMSGSRGAAAVMPAPPSGGPSSGSGGPRPRPPSAAPAGAGGPSGFRRPMPPGTQ